METDEWTPHDGKSVATDKLLTLDEAAALLTVPKSWSYARTRKGAIPHLKLGKYLRFPRVALLQWVSTQGRQEMIWRIKTTTGSAIYSAKTAYVPDYTVTNEEEEAYRRESARHHAPVMH